MTEILTPDSLNESARKYREDLKFMPIYGLAKILPYMTIVPGVVFEEVVSELIADMELGPFDNLRMGTDASNIKGRTLRTYPGNDVRPFDPKSLLKTIWGSEILQGEGLKNIPITLKVMTRLMSMVSKHFYDALFIAKRNDKGTKTVDLFDGFCTIAEQEIAAKTISKDLGNYLELTTAITKENAIDSVRKIWDAMDDQLKEQDTMMFCKPSLRTAYNRDYQTTVGITPYNTQYKKTYVEDSEEKCQLVGLSCLPDNVIIVTTKENMNIGVATNAPGCTFEVQKSLVSHFLYDFVASMFFGTQFESINKEKLLYTKIVTA